MRALLSTAPHPAVGVAAPRRRVVVGAEVKTADAAPEPPSEATPAEASSKPAPPPIKKDPVPEGKAEIYIGFEKGDYAPRSGRTGRVIVDDPSKYPDRSVYVGGWPGGEVALKSWAPKAAAEAGSGKEGSSSSSAKAKPAPAIPKAPKGAAPIYLGHAKDDYEGRREGIPGRFIVDDPSKYPDRENVGPLISAVGGFAGGEVGVKTFAATGKLPLTDAASARRQFSPVAMLFVVAGAAGVGGALLNSGVEVAEGVVEGLEGAAVSSGGGAAAAGAAAAAGRALLDPSTRTLLAVGGGLLALTGGIFGVRAAVMSARDRAAAAAETVGEGAKAAAFWVAVFFAFKLVLEST